MIKAKGTGPGGSPLYLFGLSDGNLALLRERKPIMVDLLPMGGRGHVVIMWGATEEDIARELRGLIGTATQYRDERIRTMDSNGNIYATPEAQEKIESALEKMIAKEKVKALAAEIRAMKDMPDDAEGLSEREATVLLQMNRADRRAALSDMRRNQK